MNNYSKEVSKLNREKTYIGHYKFAMGFLEIVSGEEELVSLSFCKHRNAKDRVNGLVADTQESLKRYFEGSLREFYLPLSFQGYSDFQIRIWKEMRRIPYGTISTYSDIAQKIGNPKAVRAVGTACGQNPFIIVIPCHRVVRKDLSLGGFSAGLDLKRYLLDQEQKNQPLVE